MFNKITITTNEILFISMQQKIIGIIFLNGVKCTFYVVHNS